MAAQRGRTKVLDAPTPFRLLIDKNIREGLEQASQETGQSMSQLVREALVEKFAIKRDDGFDHPIPNVGRKAMLAIRYLAPLCETPTDTIRVDRSALSLVLNMGRWDDIHQTMRNAILLLKVKHIHAFLEIDKDKTERIGFYVRFMEGKVSSVDILNALESIEQDYREHGAPYQHA